MSRVIVYDEEGNIEKEVVVSESECAWKKNGICYNNHCERILRYGKKCYIETDCKSREKDKKINTERVNREKYVWKGLW